MRFTKMQGAGNDFIIIDNTVEHRSLEDLGPLAMKLCKRRISIGADGLMVVENPQQGGHFKMLFYNADGTMGEMCGNGVRCMARYGWENGLCGTEDEITIETTAGIIKGWRLSQTEYKVRLNDVSKLDLHRKLTALGKEYDCAYVELGDPGIPHLVVEYEGLQQISPNDLWQLGSTLRHAPDLPKGANVNFYEQTGKDCLFARTFERGVEDFTYACGTGTASVVSVLTNKGLVGNHVEATMTGGTLSVDVTKSKTGTITDLYLSGPTVIVAEGQIIEE